MKFCNTCNTCLNDGINFCPNCGTKLELDNMSNESASLDNSPQLTNSTIKHLDIPREVTSFSIGEQEIDYSSALAIQNLKQNGFYCTNCGKYIGTTNQCESCNLKASKNKKIHCRYCGDKIENDHCLSCHAPAKDSLVESVFRFLSFVCIGFLFFGAFIDLLTEKSFACVLIELGVALSLFIFVIRKKQIFKIKKILIQKKLKPILIILVYALSCFISFCTIAFSVPTSNKPNQEESKLIHYIIDAGKCDLENNIYSIEENNMESGTYFSYSIEYNTKTKNLTFKEISYASELSTATYTTMHYQYGSKEQKVDVDIIMDGQYGIKSSGIIYPATYTYSNMTIYSFKSSSNHEKIQEICENNVYTMLAHCQLLMIDADTGLVPFGFEQGIYK